MDVHTGGGGVRSKWTLVDGGGGSKSLFFVDVIYGRPLTADTNDTTLLNNLPFSAFRKDRFVDDQVGGGVCIVINDRTVKAISVPIDKSFNDLDIVCVDVVNTNQPIRIIACYRPPSTDTDKTAVEQMRRIVQCLELLCDVDATVIVLGDFNLPYIDWANPVFIADSDRCSTLFTEFTSLYTLEQLVNEATRFNNKSKVTNAAAVTHVGANVGSILDLVLCNDIFAIQDIGVHVNFSTSDHCTVDFNILCHVLSSDCNYEYRNFNEADWDSINARLNAVDWMLCLQAQHLLVVVMNFTAS